jgi:aryl-alcohol dehydrogenase-like predicted oxidoreductase
MFYLARKPRDEVVSQNNAGTTRPLIGADSFHPNDPFCDPGWAALAWLAQQGGDIVPIPGTKRRKYLEENLPPPAAALTLSQTELSRIAAFLKEFRASGNRYGDSVLALIKG